jgi:CheY-like chemotaxis protein
MVEKHAERKRIRLELDLDPEVPTVVGDGRRLKQVLVNLLSNAVKFTRDGGNVRLSLRGDAERGLVEIAVADDGIGIAEETLPRLFRPFTQVESGLARRQGGTGLGLSLVLALTTLHGGGVEVKSRPGEGSTFVVRLPWSRAAAGPAPPPAETPGATPAGEGRRGKVLVVEDNEANAFVLCEYLEHAGFGTELARGGLEALRMARAAPPDVVLMDVQMPGMDGLETTRRLRSELRLDRLPILAVTALAMPGDQERCLEAGATGYLTKPLDLQGLVRSIEDALGAVKERGASGGDGALPSR